MSVPLKRELSAEDVAQEVITDALTNSEKLPESDSQLREWLRFASMHVLTDHERRIRAQKRSAQRRLRLSGSYLVGFLGRQLGRGRSPSDYLASIEAKDFVRQNLEHLHPEQRWALQLRHIEQYSVHDTARLMGRSRAAVAGLLKRGLRRLRRKMRYAPRVTSDEAMPVVDD